MADKSPRKQNKSKKVSIRERQARKKAKRAAAQAATTGTRLPAPATTGR